MRVRMGLDELEKALGFISIVIGDKSVDAKNKTVVLKVQGDTVTAMGYSPLAMVKYRLEGVTVTDGPGEEEHSYIQIKADDLKKYLSGFVNLYYTEVDWVEFVENGIKVDFIVHEVSKEDPNEVVNKKGDPRCSFNCITLQSGKDKELSTEFPEESEFVSSDSFKVYIDSLAPLMDTSNISSIGSKINFAEDYVFVTNKFVNGFFANKLPECLKGVSIGYSGINLLKKMYECFESFDLAKSENYLSFKYEGVEAYMRYMPIKSRYKKFVDDFSDEVAIVVNRRRFREALKRVPNMESRYTCKIVDGVLEITSDDFEQGVDIQKEKGLDGVDAVEFKITPSLIDKVVIGSDDSFPELLRIYIVKENNIYTLYFKDKLKAWFTCINVK